MMRILATFTLLLASAFGASSTAKQPNILFILVDDLRPTISNYGYKGVVTPNIDRLASTGVQFNQAYCSVPVCGASRASMLTGMHPTRERFKDYYSAVDEEAPSAHTLPQTFKDAGYTTISLGKVFHNKMDTADRSWSEEPWQPGLGHTTTFDPESEKYSQERSKQAPARTGKPFFEAADVPDNVYADGQIADRAIAKLAALKQSGEPFFLAMGFLKPHLPFMLPRSTGIYMTGRRSRLRKIPSLSMVPHGFSRVQRKSKMGIHFVDTN